MFVKGQLYWQIFFDERELIIYHFPGGLNKKKKTENLDGQQRLDNNRLTMKKTDIWSQLV